MRVAPAIVLSEFLRPVSSEMLLPDIPLHFSRQVPLRPGSSRAQ